ncbi:hypothetical protein EBR57_00060 [bacterium]|nr:hypothetical protein [bacterium]
MALLTEFPSGYRKSEPLNKSFDMIVRDWSRQQFGGDEIVEEIRKALNTGVTTPVYNNAAATGANLVGWTGTSYGYGQANGYGADHTAGTVLTSAYGDPRYEAGNLSALRLENLDNTMTSVLATAEHLKIFRWLHKEPSKQPFYQWNRRESYGSTRGYFGFAEGGLPNGGKGQWSRNGAYVKFLGTKGGVTHPAVLTNILGGMSVDPVAEDQLGRTMDFMQRIERAILYGDEGILDNSGVDSNYDGLVKLLTKQRTKNVIDMKGAPLTMDGIANVASRLVSEGKLLSFADVTLFMSPQNIEDFSKLRYSTVLGTNNAISGPGTTVDRSDITSSARTNLLAGLSIVGQSTSFGVIPFEWSIFTEPVEGGTLLTVGDSGAPGAPNNGSAWTTTTLTVATDLISDIGNPSTASSFPAGTYNIGAFTAGSPSSFPTNAGGSTDVAYWYRISSVNDVGESTASYASTHAVSPTGSTQEVRIRFPRVTGSGLNQARAYRVYRAEVTIGDAIPAISSPLWQYVGYVPDSNGGNAHQEFTDRNGASSLYNNIRPGTNIAPLLCRNSADLCVAQMSPLLKMPLAPVSTTFEYLLLLYHTLVLKAPERQFIFKNVGKLN